MSNNNDNNNNKAVQIVDANPCNHNTGHHIKDHVYLGPYTCACDWEFLEERKITHILTVASGLAPCFQEPPFNIKYKIIEIVDHDSEPIGRHFRRCIRFIEQAKKENGRILVHCAAGISRSATIIIAWLMHSDPQTFSTVDSAFKYVMVRRSCVYPNEGFRAQLEQFAKRKCEFPQDSFPDDYDKEAEEREQQQQQRQQQKQQQQKKSCVIH